MRIIAGEFRGLRLRANEGETTRPITDRAKQSLFDALQDCFAGQRVLDCFSGSGSMGLECLSRGAARAVFVERDRGALEALRENIEAMKGGERAVILPVDAYALAGAGLHPEMGELTIAFVDPPYSHMTTGHLRNKVDDLVRRLAAGGMVDGGIISLRHPTNVTIDAAGLGVKVVRELKYGEMGITWLTKAEGT